MPSVEHVQASAHGRRRCDWLPLLVTARPPFLVGMVSHCIFAGVPADEIARLLTIIVLTCFFHLVRNLRKRVNWGRFPECERMISGVVELQASETHSFVVLCFVLCSRPCVAGCAFF